MRRMLARGSPPQHVAMVLGRPWQYPRLALCRMIAAQISRWQAQDMAPLNGAWSVIAIREGTADEAASEGGGAGGRPFRGRSRLMLLSERFCQNAGAYCS
jgi:hypothetical protein